MDFKFYSVVICVMILKFMSLAHTTASHQNQLNSRVAPPTRCTHGNNNNNNNNNQVLPTNYTGLFYTQAQIDQLVNQRTIDELFVIKTLKASYPFPAICSANTPSSSSKGVMTSLTSQLPKCNTQPDCCTTINTLVIASEVQSANGDGAPLQVAGGTFGYQLVAIGTCVNVGSTCGQGECRQAMRTHQLLVHSETGYQFVTLKVNSHCDCVASPGVA